MKVSYDTRLFAKVKIHTRILCVRCEITLNSLSGNTEMLAYLRFTNFTEVKRASKDIPCTPRVTNVGIKAHRTLNC